MLTKHFTGSLAILFALGISWAFAALAALDALATLASLATLDALATLKRSRFRDAGHSGADRHNQVLSGTLQSALLASRFNRLQEPQAPSIVSTAFNGPSSTMSPSAKKIPRALQNTKTASLRKEAVEIQIMHVKTKKLVSQGFAMQY